MDRIVSAAQLAGMLPPRAPGIPAYQGLAESLRLLILDGQLVADLRLPSERELSGALRLSRSTVAAAYALLRERALLTARRGAGNYVTVDTGSVASELLPAPTFSRDGVIGLTCASSEAPAGLATASHRPSSTCPACWPAPATSPTACRCCASSSPTGSPAAGCPPPPTR